MRFPSVLRAHEPRLSNALARSLLPVRLASAQRLSLSLHHPLIATAFLSPRWEHRPRPCPRPCPRPRPRRSSCSTVETRERLSRLGRTQGSAGEAILMALPSNSALRQALLPMMSTRTTSLRLPQSLYLLCNKLAISYWLPRTDPFGFGLAFPPSMPLRPRPPSAVAVCHSPEARGQTVDARPCAPSTTSSSHRWCVLSTMHSSIDPVAQFQAPSVRHLCGSRWRTARACHPLPLPGSTRHPRCPASCPLSTGRPRSPSPPSSIHCPEHSQHLCRLRIRGVLSRARVFSSSGLRPHP